jgi:hypothetical protein
MIINYPTGLYTAILPRGPSDAGNVTFTISSEQPPRTSLLFPKLPAGVSGRQRNPRAISQLTRRADMAALVFTVNQVSRVVTGTAIRQYEVGQLLDFGDSSEPRTLDPNPAGSGSEIRHDTGLLDYARLGFTDAQQLVVETEAQTIFRRQQQELADYRQLYSDLQVQIQENQKLLSETVKALNALTAMGSTDPTIAEMITELTARRGTLNGERGGLVNQANEVARSAAAAQQQLLDLAQVVR